MAKGNRTINLYKDDVWKSVFFESVGTYVNVINNELSQEYPLEPLSDYIKIGGGYAFKTSEYKKSGIPIIRISDFNNEQIDISNCVYYDEDVSLSKYELKENDIIICLTGGTIAKLGIVQAGLGKLYMNQRVGRFDILDNSKFEKEYVYWIARSVQSIIKNLAWGAAIPNVSPKQIEKLQFSFPPIEVQRQIIEFLNDLKNNTIQNKVYFNESIERHIIELQNNNVALKDVNSELTHQLDLIKQLRQAFLREAMQGKLLTPVTSSGVEKQETGHDLLAKIKAEKAQLIAEKKLKKEKELPSITKDEIPFEIPEHWAWCRLGEISSIVRGGSPRPAGDPKYYDGDIPFLKVGDLTGYEGKYCNTYTHTIKKEGLYKTRYVEANTLMLTNSGATLGVPRICTFPTTFNDGIAAFLGIDNLNKEFLFYFLREKSDYFLKEASRGQGQPNLNTDIIGSTLIPLPPLHEQEQIVAKLEELLAFCDGLEQSVKESQGYNEKLLQQVLREALQG
ncbi:restriction endonuclease subunit S [Flavobacterium sp.]|uniref:restriction endonuclease subunit S n=1 Tax=Flavobacterium sp. TaxID=239 RepID=UPI0035B10C43